MIIIVILSFIVFVLWCFLKVSSIAEIMEENLKANEEVKVKNE